MTSSNQHTSLITRQKWRKIINIGIQCDQVSTLIDGFFRCFPRKLSPLNQTYVKICRGKGVYSLHPLVHCQERYLRKNYVGYKPHNAHYLSCTIFYNCEPFYVLKKSGAFFLLYNALSIIFGQGFSVFKSIPNRGFVTY